MFGLFGYPVMTSFKSELWDGTANYLILSGGGGGGGVIDGGGGAGGYRASWGTGTDGTSGNSGGLSSLQSALTLTSGTAYSITVGQGGQGGLGWNATANIRGHKGRTSSISGSDITTVTTVGGGGGKGFNYAGSTERDGGSGGGGAYPNTGGSMHGSGTAGEGFSGGTVTVDVGGGGGGAGGAGGGSTSTASAGDGGVGLASTITGTSVSRAGGGGGGVRSTTGTDNGIGVDGGGDGGVQGSVNHPPSPYGSITTEVATHGRAKYGGGGGGAGYNTTGSTTQIGGDGGSGTVILRLPKEANYNATKLAHDVSSASNCTASYLNTQVYTDDTNFDDVVLLMDGSGGGNATVVDRSSVNHTVINVSSGVSSANITGPYSATQDVLSFDGSNDKLTIADFSLGGQSFGTGDFTIECWVKCSSNFSATGNSDEAAIKPFIENDSGNYAFTDENWFKIDYDFRNTSRLVRFSASNGSGGVALASGNIGATDVSEWHHVAAVRSGSTATLYFDGVSVGTVSHSVNMAYSKNRTLQIGHQSVSGTSRWFSGNLADIRITKGVARYTANFTPPTSALPSRTNTIGGDHVILFTVATETAHPGDASNNDGTITWTPRRPVTLDPDDIRNMSTLPGTSTALGSGSLSEGNYQFNDGSDVRYQGTAFSTLGKSSGKWYVEFRGVGRPGFGLYDGVRNSNDLNHQNYANQVNQRSAINGPGRLFTPHNSDLYRWGTDLEGGYPTSFSNNTTQFKTVNTDYGTGWVSGDIVGMAFDLDAGTIEYFINGTSQGTAFSDLLSSYSSGNEWYVAVSDASDSLDTYTYVNFGQPNGATFGGTETPTGNGEFYHQPPAGFNRLAT